jgi:hypothetical protein
MRPTESRRRTRTTSTMQSMQSKKSMKRMKKRRKIATRKGGELHGPACRQ